MRHQSLPILGCSAVMLVLSTIPAHAQPQPSHPAHAVGLGQWYPYPPFGFPPGVHPGDSIVALRLLVTPREALVYVDGFAAGMVDDYDGVFQRLRVVPGPHEIVVYHPGHRTFRQHVYYNPGSTHTIRYKLDPLLPGETQEPQPVPRALPLPQAVPVRVGTLALRVQPDDATVLVDGQPWHGPQTQDRIMIPLAEGAHRVRIEKPGFQTFSVDVDVRAGETTSFVVTLTP